MSKNEYRGSTLNILQTQKTTIEYELSILGVLKIEYCPQMGKMTPKSVPWLKATRVVSAELDSNPVGWRSKAHCSVHGTFQAPMCRITIWAA